MTYQALQDGQASCRFAEVVTDRHREDVQTCFEPDALGKVPGARAE